MSHDARYTPVMTLAEADAAEAQLWATYAAEQRAARGIGPTASLDSRNGVEVRPPITVAYARAIRAGAVATVELDATVRRVLAVRVQDELRYADLPAELQAKAEAPDPSVAVGAAAGSEALMRGGR